MSEHHDDERCEPPTIGSQLRRLAPRTYVDALHSPLAGEGFYAETAGYAHPSGVGIVMDVDGIRVMYPAPWADPEYDRQAWFALPYGTSFEVIVDLAVALVVKVEADMNAEGPTAP
jgi:hypothetical protein